MRVPVQPGGLYNSQSENRTPPGRAFAISNASTDQGIWQIGQRYLSIGSRPGASASDVCFGLGYGKFTCNAVQKLQITGSPTGGTVVLRSPIQGATNSSAIAYNAYPSDAQTGISPWTSFDDGELVFSGGPWPVEPMYVTYKGRYAATAESLLTLQTNNLTGGSTPTLAISQFVTGGVAEVYLVVIQPNGSGTSTLYAVTSTDGFVTTTWTSVATGLTSSDWYFVQVADKIYAANATDGIAYYQLGGSWSGTAGIPNVQNPTSGPQAISPYYDQSASSTPMFPFLWNAGGGDATFGTFSGWGTNPTITVNTDKKSINIKLNAAVTGAQVSFVATLNAAQDLSHADCYRVQIVTDPHFTTIDPTTIAYTQTNNDGSPALISPPFYDAGSSTVGVSQATYLRNIQFGDLSRNLRDNILKFTFTFFIPTGTSGNNFTLTLYPLDGWLLDQQQTLSMLAGPTNGWVQYAYTNQKASTGVESKLSPISQASYPGYQGVPGHMQIGAVGSVQLTSSDYVNLYRRDRFGLWRLIGQGSNANPSQTLFIDKNMLDELDGYPMYGTSHLPGGYLPSNLGLWKGCLVAAGARLIWIAKPGFPTLFAPDPTNLPAVQLFETAFVDDPNAPRTVFLDASRSEDARAIIGQDSLYLSGPFTSYSMVDSDGTPDGLSPPRVMPGSRGCLSTRASFPHSGGAAIPAASGLWYYAVSYGFTGSIGAGTIIEDEISKDVRGTWNTLFGSSPASVVGVEHNEEYWVFTGGNFVKWTRNGKIEQGTFTDSVKEAIANQNNGLIFATTDGRLMKVGSQTTDNGTSVKWSWASGKMDQVLPDTARFRINGISVTAYSGTPFVQVEVWDGNEGYTEQRFDLAQTDGTNNYWPTRMPLIGSRVRITVGGTGSDTVEELFLAVEKAPAGLGN